MGYNGDATFKAEPERRVWNPGKNVRLVASGDLGGSGKGCRDGEIRACMCTRRCKGLAACLGLAEAFAAIGLAKQEDSSP